MRALERPDVHTTPADPYLASRREAVDRWLDARCTQLGHRRVADLATDPVEPGDDLDLIVAFGSLEREHDPRPLLDRLASLVRLGGDVVVVTPNRLTASPGRTRPVAPGHTWEYTPDELRHLMRRRFAEPRVFGVFHGRRLRWIERAVGSSLPLLLTTVAPADRARWLRVAMRRLGPHDFVVGPDPLRDALDLIAVGRA